MRHLVLGLLVLAGCGASPVPVASGPPASWRVPPGWRAETFPFPIEFAPTIAHRGIEELRFAPGMFDPKAPGYFSYAFVWRTDDAAALDAAAVAAELTAYFRGLATAVDQKHEVAVDGIAMQATARPAGGFALAGRMIDVFASHEAVALEGTATRVACGAGALWTIALAPPQSAMRDAIVALAAETRCGQPVAVAPK